jgi:hypothetical protein
MNHHPMASEASGPGAASSDAGASATKASAPSRLGIPSGEKSARQYDAQH